MLIEKHEVNISKKVAQVKTVDFLCKRPIDINCNAWSAPETINIEPGDACIPNDLTYWLIASRNG